MIFPQLGPAYYDERHKGILARMESSYAQSITINQVFWQEAICFGLNKSSLIDLKTLT